MLRRICFFLFLLAAFFASAGAQAASWLEVRTPHFRVISNAPEKEAQRAALQCERMRSVFARVFPDRNIDTATPIVVLAFEDKQNLQAVQSAAYLANGGLTLLGLFLSAAEKNYMLILLNAPGRHPYASIYHEYAHFVQSRLTLSIQLKLIGDTRIIDLSEKVKTGDPAAEFGLANAFFAGKDIPKDESKGAVLLQRAAREGLPEAQFQMAE